MEKLNNDRPLTELEKLELDSPIMGWVLRDLI
jgi:hypothetical protein